MNNNNKINESLLRTDSKKRMEKLYSEIEKAGGDIGEKVSKGEKHKQSDMPNAFHIDNPFGSGRHIDTFESYCLRESRGTKGNTKSLEDMYVTKDGPGIDISDDNWIKGTDEDKLRPMFNNHPDIKDRYPADILRVGKFVTIDKKTAQILSLKNNVVLLDIINDENEHEIKEMSVTKLLKQMDIKKYKK